jgi:hypothetical protein
VIDLAVDEALARRDIGIAPPEATGPGTEEELEAIIRRDMIVYKRLREEKLNHRSSTGYFPREIRRHGIVNAIDRAVHKGTDGLRFLIDHDRLDLTVEYWVTNRRFHHLFRPETVRRAEQVLREAQLIVDSRKQDDP